MGLQPEPRVVNAILDADALFRKIRPIWDKGDILAMNAAWGEAGLEGEYYGVITRMFEKLTAAG